MGNILFATPEAVHGNVGIGVAAAVGPFPKFYFPSSFFRQRTDAVKLEINTNETSPGRPLPPTSTQCRVALVVGSNRDAHVLVVCRGFDDPVEGGSASCDAFDDLVGGAGPHEWFGVVVPVLDPPVDAVLEVAG